MGQFSAMYSLRGSPRLLHDLMKLAVLLLALGAVSMVKCIPLAAAHAAPQQANKAQGGPLAGEERCGRRGCSCELLQPALPKVAESTCL